MPFKKGEKRPANAGKKKGSVNKSSLLVREVLDNHGINIVEQILVRLPQINKDKQVQALCALLPYVYPKLTSTDVNLTTQGFRVILEDYTSKTSKKLE